MAMTGYNAKLVHTGYGNGNSSKPIYVYVAYKSSQSITKNQSTVSVGMYVVTPANYPIGKWTDYYGSYVGTADLTFDGTIPNFTGTRWLVENKTFTVDHDNEGKATATIKWKWGVWSDWGKITNPSGSFNITLPTIPRASTVGATDANIGSKSTVIVSRKSTSYKHSIAYKFGNISGWITADGGTSSTEEKFDETSISWTIPISFYAQIPNEKSGTCTLTIKTYSGTTQIGSAQTSTFTVTAAQSLSAPVVSGTVVDSRAETQALTGDNTILVRYRSTALCTISATAKNSATISKTQINGKAVSGNTLSIPEIEISSVPFYAEDSRGYGTSAQTDFELIPYIPLTAHPEATKVNPGTLISVLTLEGNYFNGSFGAAENALTIQYSVDGGDTVEVEPRIYGNKYTATVEIPDLDYTVSHSAEVTVSDLLDTVTKTVAIGRSIPIDYWNDKLYGFTTNIVAPRFVKMGTVWITPTAADTPTEGEVIFAEPFDGAPIVALGVVSKGPGTAVQGATIMDVTESGFKIWLTRSDTVRTLIHWIAVYQPPNPLERSTYSMMSESNIEEGGT